MQISRQIRKRRELESHVVPWNLGGFYDKRTGTLLVHVHCRDLHVDQGRHESWVDGVLVLLDEVRNDVEGLCGSKRGRTVANAH